MSYAVEVIPIKYLLAVQRIFGLHLNTYYPQFLAAFGSWAEVWRAKSLPPQLELPHSLWERFQQERLRLVPERLAEELEQKGINAIRRDEPGFPPLLLQISNVPCILYYCGNPELFKRTSVAVVGSRKATAYGLKQAQQISYELAKRGLVITSGMARGIDGAAHAGALEAGGATIAVLGCGVDISYPRENQQLLQKVRESGLVISEYHPGTEPLPFHFPIRNRIISGLSRAVFVVEAQAQSGTLITCDFALEQGKEIFALPGPVTSPNSIGTLRLIQNGAKLVIHPGDILEELGYEFRESLFSAKDEITRNISMAEKKVLACIGWEPIHLDALLAGRGTSASLYQDLLLLEIKGLIKQLPGKYYVKI